MLGTHKTEQINCLPTESRNLNERYNTNPELGALSAGSDCARTFSERMRFEIPKEHRKTPEAKELIRLDKEFSKACAREARAMKRDLLNKDPDAFLKLSMRTQKLLQQLSNAEEDYDKSTGEPRPVELADSIRNRIRDSFEETAWGQIELNLAKTLAYMKRNGWSDPRIQESIFVVAEGDADAFARACEQARTDYRDLLLAARI